MPKMKTHKAAAKRYRVTGSGKIVRRKMNRGHLLAKKSGARKRRLAMDVPVHPGFIKRVERMLGIRGLRPRSATEAPKSQD